MQNEANKSKRMGPVKLSSSGDVFKSVLICAFKKILLYSFQLIIVQNFWNIKFQWVEPDVTNTFKQQFHFPYIHIVIRDY